MTTPSPTPMEELLATLQQHVGATATSGLTRAELVKSLETEKETLVEQLEKLTELVEKASEPIEDRLNEIDGQLADLNKKAQSKKKAKTPRRLRLSSITRGLHQ